MALRISVDDAIEAVFEFGAAHCPTIHREAYDVAGGTGLCGFNVTASPQYTPQTTIRREGEIPYPVVAEVKPHF